MQRSRLLVPIAAAVLAILMTERASAEPIGPQERQRLRAMQRAYRYTDIARAYADYMIEHGRDVYGSVHSPLFITGIDRLTGKRIRPPFPHVKRKPFMAGFERDRECRDSDRNYGNADPLDQMTLLRLLQRLTEVTGESRYAQETDKTASWWMENTQTPIGLYPWGTHTSWNVETDGGGGTFEFNHVWPYWDSNPEALQRYAMGLWDHYVADKRTGDFNRHANSNRHGPSGGKEFPWPGSAMIATWCQAYLAEPNPEYVRAIEAILRRWESLRDENGHLAPCSDYGEWAWYGGGYTVAANRLDDWAALIEAKEPELARKMRDYGRKSDAAYFKLADRLLDVKRVGIVKSYLRATGDYNPERLDILGGPWQDRKNYASLALLLAERARRTESEAIRDRYRRAVLDTAEVYMSINPEVQWAVWGANMSDAIALMFTAYDLTGNAAYLHRADHFGRLCVDLFLDDVSPLPKITSHDDFYEIERVTGKSTDAWMLDLLELQQRLDALDESARQAASGATVGRVTVTSSLPVLGASATRWQDDLKQAVADNRAGLWDCTKLSKPAASVALAYGKGGERSLFLSRRKEMFHPSDGLAVDRLELIASDVINKIPTLAEAKPLNGPYRRRFSGKHREVCTAVYGGFKDVLSKAGLLLVNRGENAAKITVTATFHDTWDDRETREDRYTLGPGERILAVCAAPDERFIRRLDLAADTPGVVKLERFAFVMTPRDRLARQETPAAAKGWPREVETVRHTATADNTRQPMLRYTAKAKEERPLLVGLHTWSAGYDQAGGETVYARWCIENDWHFVHPHFRGPNWTPEACGSEMVVRDILDAVAHMRKHHAVDADRIYLVGVSGGGHAALLMAGRAPDVWAGVSAWVPISDIRAWWEQKSRGSHSKYAKHIEKAVGGRPDMSERAAAECVRRSPVTYLAKAAGVNLDINAGVTDGHSGGSVPFTHSLRAFNAVVPEADRLPSPFIEDFYRLQELPEGMAPAEPDPLYGKKPVILRKTSGNTRVTIFQGGHEIIHRAALNWLATQRKGKPAQWSLAEHRGVKASGQEGESGK